MNPKKMKEPLFRGFCPFEPINDWVVGSLRVHSKMYLIYPHNLKWGIEPCHVHKDSVGQYVGKKDSGKFFLQEIQRIKDRTYYSNKIEIDPLEDLDMHYMKLKIFEGDIVRFLQISHTLETVYTYEDYIMRWCEDDCAFIPKGIYPSNWYCKGSRTNWVAHTKYVVGNEFQHPDLIEKYRKLKKS